MNTSSKRACTPVPNSSRSCTFLSWMVGKDISSSQICGISFTSNSCTAKNAFCRSAGSGGLTGVGKQPVHLGIHVAAGVREHDLLDVGGDVGPLHPQRRVAILVQVVDRGVVVPIRHAPRPAAGIGALQRDLDADLLQRSADVLRQPRPHLAIGQGQVADLEADPIRTRLHPGLVQQCAGRLHVVRRKLHRRVEVAGGGGDRAGRDLADAEPQAVEDEVAVERHADRLAHPHVVQRLHPVVQLQPHQAARNTPSPWSPPQVGLLAEPRHVERLDVAGRGHQHLPGLQRERAALAVRDDAVGDARPDTAGPASNSRRTSSAG